MKEKIKITKGKVSLRNAANNYIYMLLKIFESDYELFKTICEKYDFDEEELLQIFEKGDYNNIQLYDDILTDVYELKKNK